jgi:hypothetical protein
LEYALKKLTPLSQKVLDDVPRRQVVLRTTSTNDAGLGSVVAQLRSSAAIATMLGASFQTYGVVSSHTYRVAEQLHLDILENPLDVGGKVCSFINSPGYFRALELVEAWCNDKDAHGHAVEMRGLFSDCDLILDDRPWDVRYDMSKCTWRWVRQIFSNSVGLKTPRKGIGLHKRWGDMSTLTWSNDPLTPQRSTPIDKAADLLRKMRECGIHDELSVYMEWHNTTMLRGLGEPYRIVDTGDSFDDLVDLASNRLMILDLSSWTVLAHNIAAGGVTVVPDIDQFSITWDDNGVNNVLRWEELLTVPCSELLTLYGD